MRRVAFRLPLLDVAVAVALLAVRLVTLAAGVQAGGAVSYALAPLWTLPFAWRRSHPLAVAVLVAGANLIEVGAGGYHNSIIFVVAYLLAPFSLATNAGNAWRMAGGLLALFVAGGVSQAAQPSPHGFTGWSGTLAGDIALILAPFFVGLALRQQRLRAEASEQLAARLAREKEERARTAVAEERSRIARELHDEVAHAMSVIAVQADAAEGALAHDPALDAVRWWRFARPPARHWRTCAASSGSCTAPTRRTSPPVLAWPGLGTCWTRHEQPMSQWTCRCWGSRCRSRPGWTWRRTASCRRG